MTDRQAKWTVPAVCNNPRWQVLLGTTEPQWRDCEHLPIGLDKPVWDEARNSWQTYLSNRPHPARKMGGVN